MTDDAAAAEARDQLLGSAGKPASRSIDDVRAELAAMEAAQPAGDGMVKIKVEPPHDALVFSGLTIGREWTQVPERHLPALLAAAERSGVTITQEEVI